MRDDFSANTKEILAKRVAYICSNPNCRKPTIGPNSDLGKTTLIGVAAHITAASPGGPRFNSNLTNEERKFIENGVWLCQNCAALIDKDEGVFTVEQIEKWKITAEDVAFRALQVGNFSGTPVADRKRPYAEAELIWTSSFKRSLGASHKTKEIYGDEPISIMQVIWYNHISWYYGLKIYNNSSVPLFNLKIHIHSKTSQLNKLDLLPKINNLPPYRDVELRAETELFFEGTGEAAMEIMKPKFPHQIQGLKILLEYNDEDRMAYYTELILNQEKFEIFNRDVKPSDYN